MFYFKFHTKNASPTAKGVVVQVLLIFEVLEIKALVFERNV